VRLLATLTDRERQVVVAGTTSISEAAELGLAPGTVTSTLSRALGKLRVSTDGRPPPKLSPLAKWALAEIPGARRMSAYQVVLPDPGVPTEMDAEGFAVDQGPLALTCLAREGDD